MTIAVAWVVKQQTKPKTLCLLVFSTDNLCKYSAVGSKSDCRSRGGEFDPDLVPYFSGIDHEMISTVILLLPLIQEELLSFTRKSMSMK